MSEILFSFSNTWNQSFWLQHTNKFYYRGGRYRQVSLYHQMHDSDLAINKHANTLHERVFRPSSTPYPQISQFLSVQVMLLYFQFIYIGVHMNMI